MLEISTASPSPKQTAIPELTMTCDICQTSQSYRSVFIEQSIEEARRDGWRTINTPPSLFDPESPRYSQPTIDTCGIHRVFNV